MVSYISTRGQAWSTDFIVGILMFIVAVTIFMIYSSNIFGEDLNEFSHMEEEAESVSSALMDSGSPGNWTSDYVARIGITDNNHRINLHKIHNLSVLDYDESKVIMGTSLDYAIFFLNVSGSVTDIGGFCGKAGPAVQISQSMGQCFVNLSQINPKSLVKAERILIYPRQNSSSIVKMVFYLWD